MWNPYHTQFSSENCSVAFSGKPPHSDKKIDYYLFRDIFPFCTDIFIVELALFYFFGLSDSQSPEIIYLWLPT